MNRNRNINKTTEMLTKKRKFIRKVNANKRKIVKLFNRKCCQEFKPTTIVKKVRKGVDNPPFLDCNEFWHPYRD
jgi:hypothetical protein